MKIVSIGEILWDVFENAEQLGGAPFNFAAHAARLGHDVVLVSAVGDDERGAEALRRLRELGVRPEFVQEIAGTATGTVTVRVDSAGQPDFTIHRPAAYDCLRLDRETLDRLASWQPDWLYFGTLHQARPEGRVETEKLIAALPGARRFYDINLRRDSYTPELVSELLPAADVAKLNEDEMVVIESLFGVRSGSFAQFTEDAAKRFGWDAVAVTRGSRGCAIRIGSDYAEPPGYSVKVVDTVGAGDAFAAAFLHGLSNQRDAQSTGSFANRLGALVASHPGGVPGWSIADLQV